MQLQLPSWRPGRYEKANYAQFIKSLSVAGPNAPVRCEKKTGDLWEFLAEENGPHSINYFYHAAQMDAGGSWVDAEQVYINFINLAFSIRGREEETIEVSLDLPDNYRLACALPQLAKNLLQAKNFQVLVDSPLIASPKLQHRMYAVNDSSFHIWVSGKVFFDWENTLSVFSNFTKAQIADFGEFPAGDYHFLIHLLPFSHYHGVEHKYSTVITIGTDESLGRKEGWNRLIGVCSHELYHFWNVCRIRPKALLPYDFSVEGFFSEGLLAEGVTSFMGDFYLLKSGHLSVAEYLLLLEKLFERAFENLGWENQSIAASSWDLWLDGYKAGVPDKKVSIYTHGALITLALDLLLIQNGHRMHEAMRQMWEKYGRTQKGYNIEDFKSIVTSLANNRADISSFFARFVYGTADLYPLLEKLLPTIGLQVRKIAKKDRWETAYGIKVNSKGEVLKIHPRSMAYEQMMIGDRIFSYQLSGEGLHLKFDRRKSEMEVFLSSSDKMYYADYKITLAGSEAAFSEFINS